MYKSDIEIAQENEMLPIDDIAAKAGIDEKYVEHYGKYKAKINQKAFERLKDKENGKLILVTAMNPTPLGEGKTTISIAIADGLNKINKNAVLALREPSLGPVFGMKGGATGGGYAQIAPMEDINLHFNGDIHAITSANNLLSAIIDNHIYFGNKLNFKKVVWKRCLDVNDRSLRKIKINLSSEKRNIEREDSFDITVASEIMAIFCLATDLTDLQNRISNIIVGYNYEDKPITVKDLKADGAMTVLLKDAFNPNLVQTLENTPALVHGGPFANIAHGCNSIISTKIGLKLADYVVTEAGFGADLGAEKFHGGVAKENVEKPNIEAVRIGINNLKIHIKNIKEQFNLNVVVALNKYSYDTKEEIELLECEVNKIGIQLSIVEVWEKGGKGAIDLAKKVEKLCNKETNMKYTYNLELSIEEKIKRISQNIYKAQEVDFIR